MSQAVRPPTLGWIAFAFGIVIVAIAVLAQLERARGLVQRIIDVAMVALGGLAIAFGIAASGTAERWTAFAFALGWVVLGVVGLTAHEIAQWRSARGLGQLHGFPQMQLAPAIQPRDQATAQDRQRVA